MGQDDRLKAAHFGEPSYVWRTGQQRRLEMILSAVEGRKLSRVLENGCGVGMYVKHLEVYCQHVTGLEFDFERAAQAQELTRSLPSAEIICAAGEQLPFPEETFELILSHEVLEHVTDDLLAIREMVRCLKKGGRIVLFVPNRGYPFETHGVFWRGHYHFGNIPLVNYLPKKFRDKLAPHVRVYTKSDIERLLIGLPVKVCEHKVIFGAYDNIIARAPLLGKVLRFFLQGLERTPLQFFGLSHFWVIEKE